MDWKEVQDKIASYSFHLRMLYINEHGEYKHHEMVKRIVFEDQKKKFEEVLVVDNAVISGDGKIEGYYLHSLTKTGRISSHCIYYHIGFSDKPYTAKGHNYIEKLERLFVTLPTYVDKNYSSRKK